LKFVQTPHYIPDYTGYRFGVISLPLFPQFVSVA
jgi:hypothetical protein